MTLQPNNPIASQLLRTAQQQDQQPALAFKHLGLWRRISWARYALRVQTLAGGLIDAGLQPGDRVAILSQNRPEWLLIDQGCLYAGGTSVGLYATAAANQVRDQINHAGVNYLFLEDWEQLEKWQAVAADCPTVRQVFILEGQGLVLPPGMRHYSLFMDSATPLPEPKAAADPALILYTSGTTGEPKGVPLCQAHLMASAQAAMAAFNFRSSDRAFSYLPLSHIAERMFNGIWPLFSGTPVHFMSQPDQFLQELREVQPSVLFGVPRIWQKLKQVHDDSLTDATPLQRWTVAKGWMQARQRRFLGLEQLRLGLTGSAALDLATKEWLHTLGIRLTEAYGLTECTGIATLDGEPFGDTVVRCAEDGEILLQGSTVFDGYYREAPTPEPWFATGDLGELTPDGSLTLTGRKKDLLVTATGKNIPAGAIENALRAAPAITDALVIAEGRRFVTALILPDRDQLTRYAQDQGIAYDSYPDLVASDGVQQLIQQQVDRVNQGLSQAEQLRGFVLIDRELGPDDPEMTATNKLRRVVLEQAYEKAIDQLYQNTLI